MKEGEPIDGDNIQLAVSRFLDALNDKRVESLESFLVDEPSFSPEQLLRLLQAEIAFKRRQGLPISLAAFRQRIADSALLGAIDPDAVAELLLLPPPPPKRKPQFPDRYQAVVEIGRGGMGVVWRIHDKTLKRTLAAKVLRRNYQSNPHLNSRLEREAILTGALQHPGIPPIHDQGKLKDGSAFFAMKLVEGQTMAKMLKQQDQHDLTMLLGVFEQVAQTVAYAHSQSIIHRDLKPQNIMVGAFGEVQIMDWGMAKRMDEPVRDVDINANVGPTSIDVPRSLEGTDPALRSLTQIGDVFGTPGYMPPEQAKGELEKMNSASDVFALGSILFEILTGHRLLEEVPANQIVAAAAKGDLETSFRTLEQANVAPELKSICRDCLQADPDARPENGTDVAVRIQQYLSSVEQRLQAAEISRTKAETKAEEERKRRKLSTLLTATIGLAVAIGIAAWAWYQYDVEQRRRANLKTRAQTVVQALGNTPASTVPFAIENLRPYGAMVLPMLQEAFDDAENVNQKINYALAIGNYGLPDIVFLVSELPNIEDEDVPLVLQALRRDAETANQQIAIQFKESSDNNIRGRLATVSLCLGNEKLVAQLTSGSKNVTDRVTWINSHETWTGETQPLMDLALSDQRPDITRYAALLALSKVNFKRLSPLQKEKYTKALYQQYVSPVAANVRAGTETLLKHLDLPRPSYTASPKPKLPPAKSPQNWFVNSIGQIMVRVSIGGYDTPRREIYIADREVTAAEYQRFLNSDKETASRKRILRDPRTKKTTTTEETYAEYMKDEIRILRNRSRTAKSLDDIPMEKLGFYELLRFCNWMSRQEGLRPCYENYSPPSVRKTFSSSQQEYWRQDWLANGYRLPTEVELLALISRPSQDGHLPVIHADFDSQLGYAWIAKNSSEPKKPATRAPDINGLYDLLGNLEEASNFQLDSGLKYMPAKIRMGCRVLGGSIKTQKLEAYSKIIYPYGNGGNTSFGELTGFRIVRTAPNDLNQVAAHEIKKQIRLLESAAEANPTLRLLIWNVSDLINRLSIKLIDLGKLDEAERSLRSVIKHCDRAIELGFRVDDAMVSREGARVNLAIAQKDHGNDKGAEASAKRAMIELNKLNKKRPEIPFANTYLSNARRVYTSARMNLLRRELTEFQSNEPNKEETERRYAEMLKTAKSLMVTLKDDVWQAHLLIAKLNAGIGNDQESLTSIRQAIRSAKTSRIASGPSPKTMDEMKQLESQYARKAAKESDDF